MNTDNLQRAIYTALTTNLEIIASGASVYADTPQSDDSQLPTDFPYITLGQDRAASWDTKTDFGSQTTCQIDVWTRENNFLQCKQIASEVWAALHHQPLTIADANHTMTIVQNMAFTNDPDGLTRHGIIQALVSFTNIGE